MKRYSHWFAALAAIVLVISGLPTFEDAFQRNMAGGALVRFLLSRSRPDPSELTKTISGLQRWVSDQPDMSDSRTMLAQLYAAKGRSLYARGARSEAIADLKMAWTNAPSLNLLNHDLGVAYAETGQPVLAMFYLKRQLELHPEPWTWVYLGTLYLGMNQLDQAEASYRAALTMTPYADDGAYDGLARVYFQIGAYSQAADYARKAAELRPDRWDYWLDLARASCGSGDSDQAVRAYERAFALNPTSSALGQELDQAQARACRSRGP